MGARARDARSEARLIRRFFEVPYDQMEVEHEEGRVFLLWLPDGDSAYVERQTKNYLLSQGAKAR